MRTSASGCAKTKPAYNVDVGCADQFVEETKSGEKHRSEYGVDDDDPT